MRFGPMGLVVALAACEAGSGDGASADAVDLAAVDLATVMNDGPGPDASVLPVDGAPQVPPGDAAPAVDVPAPAELPADDDFEGAALDPAWTIFNPDVVRAEVADGALHLTLTSVRARSRASVASIRRAIARSRTCPASPANRAEARARSADASVADDDVRTDRPEGAVAPGSRAGGWVPGALDGVGGGVRRALPALSAALDAETARLLAEQGDADFGRIAAAHPAGSWLLRLRAGKLSREHLGCTTPAQVFALAGALGSALAVSREPS